ncbi:Na/Pi cotransporter family protein [Pelagimonas varians]|uniref:Na+/Pi-cotransporter n=1 Tax=Pelagimonas varians TaxID=696760 RepID=A0A238K6L0_9RHOB|nr:Na/Pi symporter [Pelagimonas varians]PYG31924.1 phosphate:Na+ symporter [Pelagimonas varians]SMX38433.1 Na+/Pi-cotransporter [Pelagimonas varians]
MKKFILPVILLVLIFGFWVSTSFQEIAAGVAIFLFGMLMLEDGFKLFSGGYLERILEKATASVPKSLGFGIAATTIMQSSSLVSVITISFLSAGLISLLAGVGIIFGANIGTTTGAWLVAGFGLKVKISAYALPMLAISIVLVFQKSKYLKGTGFVLAGLGFLFLGIHYMKEGFEAVKDQVDLTRFAMTGLLGLVVYTFLGATATVVMQSSHATMVLIITALASGQISYENALALAIGANIGTTITAILGALTANFQGKRLALAHLIFNLVTAGVALVFINQIRASVDAVSGFVGIADTDYALKLAVFHTIFNVLGVALMLPFLRQLISFLERTIAQPKEDLSQPKYLSGAVDEFPQTSQIAMRREVQHLYDNSVELIAHGLNLHRHDLFETDDIAITVENSQTPYEFDLDTRYEHRIKTLYSAIVEFATRVGTKDMPADVMDDVYAMRDVAGHLVRAVKSVKHLRRNAALYTEYPQGVITDLYNGLRTEIARILVEIRKLELADPENRSGLWLDQERIQVESDAQDTNQTLETLIRDRQISASMATSFLNDSHYAYSAMRDLLEAARAYYIETEDAMAEVERILSLEDDELTEMTSKQTTASEPKPD